MNSSRFRDAFTHDFDGVGGRVDARESRKVGRYASGLGLGGGPWPARKPQAAAASFAASFAAPAAPAAATGSSAAASTSVTDEAR